MTVSHFIPDLPTGALAACFVAIGGCAYPAGSHASGTDDRSEFAKAWPSPGYQPLVHPDTVPVIEGRLPLLYQVKRSAAYQFVDITTGDVLATVDAGTGTVLRLDSQTGISAGDKRVRPDALSPDHEYVIYVPTEPDGSWRSGVWVAPTPKPAVTRPAAGP